MCNLQLNIGLGTFRFFLAFLVAISHLWKDMLHGPAAYSVWGFFVLSGFLMTLILKKKYGLDKKGLQQYAFNRFLRIYPSYIVCCILGGIVLNVFNNNNDVLVINPSFVLPQNLIDWLSNVFMIPNTSYKLFVPVAGALFTEVWAYMLMPLAAKSKSAAWLGLVVSAFANYNYGFDVGTFSMRYSMFASAIIAFFVGSLCLHYYQELKKFAMPKTSIFVWCVHSTFWLIDDSYPWRYGIYFSLLCSAWVTISLFAIKTGKMDKLLGDMSYLVYLLHSTIGVCIYGYFNDRSLVFFFYTILFTFIISYVMVVFFERPLQYRFKIKLQIKQSKI